jgi:hypothetical protein
MYQRELVWVDLSGTEKKCKRILRAQGNVSAVWLYIARRKYTKGWTFTGRPEGMLCLYLAPGMLSAVGEKRARIVASDLRSKWGV